MNDECLLFDFIDIIFECEMSYTGSTCPLNSLCTVICFWTIPALCFSSTSVIFFCSNLLYDYFHYNWHYTKGAFKMIIFLCLTSQIY